MRRKYRIIFVLASIAAAAVCVLPLMSAQSGGTESCNLIVRGFNLVEFSAWGSVCLVAPLLIPAILLGSQSHEAQEFEIMCLFLGNIVCYVHAFNAARIWLEEHSASLITYHPNMLWYPLAFIAVLILGWVFVRISIEQELTEQEEVSEMSSNTIAIGGLRNMINPLSEPIWKIARCMRIRPETVFQIVSNAFDASIRNGTMITDSDRLCFDANIASFTLTREEGEKGSWRLAYEAKEPIINEEIFAHPKEVFVAPECMTNNVRFPFPVLRRLNWMITGEDEVLTEDLLDQLVEAYQLAYENGDVESCDDSVKFNTSFRAKGGGIIYGVIEPDFYDPIPNTWELSRVELERRA